jgi:hypothetical protein
MNYPFGNQIARVAKLALASLVMLPLSNCVHQSTRQIAPSTSEHQVAKMRSFYVRKHADDDYKLGEDIVAQLQEMGYRATTGSAASPPTKVDGVITYMDRWTWDITMYMISLDMQLREPVSDFSLVTAKTMRSSAVRKSQKEMVRETLTKLLKNS